MNRKNFMTEEEYEYHSLFDLKINRLKSSLQGRINLLNLMAPMVDKNHKHLTMENIKIDVNSEKEIQDYLIKNTNYIESFLSGYMQDWFLSNGTEKQKKRVLGAIK